MIFKSFCLEIFLVSVLVLQLWCNLTPKKVQKKKNFIFALESTFFSTFKTLVIKFYNSTFSKSLFAAVQTLSLSHEIYEVREKFLFSQEQLLLWHNKHWLLQWYNASLIDKETQTWLYHFNRLQELREEQAFLNSQSLLQATPEPSTAYEFWGAILVGSIAGLCLVIFARAFCIWACTLAVVGVPLGMIPLLLWAIAEQSTFIGPLWNPWDYLGLLKAAKNLIPQDLAIEFFRAVARLSIPLQKKILYCIANLDYTMFVSLWEAAKTIFDSK